MDIFLLKISSYFVYYEVFLDKDTEHYIQYKPKGSDLLEVKHGKLEELIGQYPYGDDVLVVELIRKTIEL